MKINEIRFWVYYFLLNLFIFLPAFIINTDHATFFPDFSIQDSFSEKWNFFFRRENSDVFKLSVDLLLLVVVILTLRKIPFSRLKRMLFFILCLILIIYNTYQNVMSAVYQTEPLLYSDYYLLMEGLAIFFAEVELWIIMLTFLASGIAVIGLYFLTRALINISEKIDPGKSMTIILVILLIISISSVVNFATRLANPHLSFPVHTYSFYDNLKRSFIVYKSTKAIDLKKFHEVYNYSGLVLNSKPNIYLLFVESYGKVLYDNNQMKESFLRNLTKLNDSMAANGWHIASSFSASPVAGGRSWLAYTSFMLGAKIDKHATYQYVVSNKEYVFPTFFKSLKNFGYRSYWLSVIPDKRKDIPYEDYKRFYGVDEWIGFNDLKYNGAMYGALSAPPDQYSLNFASEYIHRKSTDPFVMFFISLNSHYPFDSPQSIEKDWKVLVKDSHKIVPKAKEGSFEAYELAIRYQLDYLTDFIIKKGTENDVFVLIGDHQPPFLTKKNDGFLTPVHIVSKSEKFINGFYREGFNVGLIVDDDKEISYHMGLYSLFMRELIRSYSEAERIPVFIPKGLRLNPED